MKVTTDRPSRASGPGHAMVPASRFRPFAVLSAATLVLALCAQLLGNATAAAGAGLPSHLRVGHTVRSILVPGF
jgi:hypothetical protein